MEHEMKKVLIADDNKSFLMYMAILLKRMGFHVMLADNGVETVKLIKLMQPDLVLLDNMMPRLDGISVLRLIRSDADVTPVSIVMMSTNPKTARDSEKFDGCGFLTKPVQIEDLHEVLQNCIFKPMGFVRKHLRIPFTQKVTITCDGIKHDLFAETLSEGGMYIRKKDPFPVSTSLEISIPLKDSSALSFKGRVIYVKGLSADLFRVPPGMAVEFMNVSRDDAAALSSFIKECLAKDIWEDQAETYIKKTE
jgi:CheY-like chemotaxis protein